MKLEKIGIFILQFDLGNPGLIKNCLIKNFRNANFLPAALTLKD